jgi:APA family basic amino acid/polyamine antiporter
MAMTIAAAALTYLSHAQRNPRRSYLGNPLFATEPLDLLLFAAQDRSEHTLRRTIGIGRVGRRCDYRGRHFYIGRSCRCDQGRSGITLSFVLAARCGFAALCYSEYATMIPIAGSVYAYSYAYSYATMGEVLASIIGWNLVPEYGVGAAIVSVGSLSTPVALLHQFHIDLPSALLASPWQQVH